MVWLSGESLAGLGAWLVDSVIHCWVCFAGCPWYGCRVRSGWVVGARGAPPRRCCGAAMAAGASVSLDHSPIFLAAAIRLLAIQRPQPERQVLLYIRESSP